MKVVAIHECPGFFLLLAEASHAKTVISRLLPQVVQSIYLGKVLGFLPIHAPHSIYNVVGPQQEFHQRSKASYTESRK